MKLASWTLKLALGVGAVSGIVYACRTDSEASTTDTKQPPPRPSGSAVPSGIPPKQDASIDAVITLPPVPDASVLRDAGTPMR